MCSTHKYRRTACNRNCGHSACNRNCGHSILPHRALQHRKKTSVVCLGLLSDRRSFFLLHNFHICFAQLFNLPDFSSTFFSKYIKFDLAGICFCFGRISQIVTERLRIWIRISNFSKLRKFWKKTKLSGKEGPESAHKHRKQHGNKTADTR